MSRRPLVALLVVLLVCAAVAFFVQGPGSADWPRDREAFVPGLKAGDVVRISAARAAAEVVLTREGGGWKLGAAKEPADGDAVEALLAKLVGALEGPVVSTNPAKQAAYETGTGVPVRLEGAGGKVLAAFVVGKRGPDFASCYVRRDGSAQVLLVAPDLRVDVTRPAESWREPPKR